MRARTKKNTGLMVLFATGVALVGCVGDVGGPPEPNEKVATLLFRADKSAALVAQECQAPADCRLPNQQLCHQLLVEVYGDGHTVGTCWLRDGTVLQLDGNKDGIPLNCRSHTGQYAVNCLDSNNNVAVDGTEQGVAVYPSREPSWYKPAIGQIGNDGAYLTDETPVPTPPEGQTPGTPQTPTPPDQPQQGSGNPQLDAACRNKAIDAFNQAFQQVIYQEGMTGISYQPGPAANTSGFYGNGSYQDNASQLCNVQKPACKPKSHWSQWFGGGGGFQWYGGGCYCSVTNFGPSCYTSLMITAAKVSACQSMPPECDTTVWNTGVQDATVPAKQFVDKTNSATDTKAGINAGVNAGLSLLSLLSSFGGVNNYGSPLVLDLGDDGIALSSATNGVVFDLVGSGRARTAWVEGGDDALLAIDLDGNGRIDDGGELFGEGSRVTGFGGGDGFAALATLDRPENGGNGNGLVEPDDVMFDRLLLWRDANRDGVSQPSELATVRSAGVRALGTTVESDRPAFDAHGNDLSARGSFSREDGRAGVMVDVFFLRP
jgi:hypothetical protein